MHAHVTVLSAAAVSSALWVDGDVVERSEVTPDTTNLLHEDLVVEPRLELSLPRAGGGDVHGGLTTAENNVVLDGRQGSAVERCVGGVGLENFEVGGGDLKLFREGIGWWA